MSLIARIPFLAQAQLVSTAKSNDLKLGLRQLLNLSSKKSTLLVGSSPCDKDVG